MIFFVCELLWDSALLGLGVGFGGGFAMEVSTASVVLVTELVSEPLELAAEDDDVARSAVIG